MTPTAPTRPTLSTGPPNPLLPVSHQSRIPLTADLAAAAAARAVVEHAIRVWRVPVDADVAVLLTSELVSNAVTHGTPAQGAFVLLMVTCDTARLRVDVHDGSRDLPVLATALLDGSQAEAETGRGLLLVTTLSAEWGFYRTATGKAVYFTLDLQRAAQQAVVADPDERGARSVS